MSEKKEISRTGFVEDRHYRLFCIGTACDLAKAIEDTDVLMKFLEEDK